MTKPSKNVIKQRLHRGWSKEDAENMPVMKRGQSYKPGNHPWRRDCIAYNKKNREEALSKMGEEK
jgi:hypothetical protein